MLDVSLIVLVKTRHIMTTEKKNPITVNWDASKRSKLCKWSDIIKAVVGLYLEQSLIVTGLSRQPLDSKKTVTNILVII